MTMVAGYARQVDGLLIPSRTAEDLFAGWWWLLARLGGVPRTLVWDGEGAVGKYRRGGLNPDRRHARLPRRAGR